MGGGELREVVELVGKTHRATVDEHEVTTLARDLVHLKDTTAHHGLLELVHEVLAETQRPAHAHLADRLGELVHKTVDLGERLGLLDLLAREEGRGLATTEAEARGGADLDTVESTEGGEEVANGGEGTLLLATVVNDLVLGGDGVRLEGKVVVGDLVALARDGLEDVVGSVLETLSELNTEEALHGTLLVLSNTLGSRLGLGLTELDGAGDGLVHVSLEGLGLLLDETTVGGTGLGNVHHDTSDTGNVSLVALEVGSNSVGQHDDLGAEHPLGVLEGVAGGNLGSRDGAVEATAGREVAGLHLGHTLVKLLGGAGKVAGHGDAVAGSTGTEVTDAAHSVASKGLHLLGGGSLVLVHEHLQLATGTASLGVTLVGDLADTLDLTSDTTVDTHLVGLHGDNLGGHNGDLGSETSLDILDVGGHGGEVGGERLAELSHLAGSLGASGAEVLDSLGEAGVSEGSLLGESVVETVGGGSETRVGAGTVGSELAVHLVELVVRVNLGLGDGATESLQGTGVTGGIRGTGAAKGSSGALALSVDLVEDRGGGSLELGGGGLSVGSHAGGVRGDTHVGLLDLLGSLGPERELGASLGGDSTRDHASDLLLVAGELDEESLAGHGRASTGAGRLAHEVEHLPLGSGDGETEVLLGDGRGGADGVHHLLLELGAGGLKLEGDGLEGRVGLLGELGHLSLEAELHGHLGLLVHGLADLEDSLGTTLTLLDGGTERALKLSLVGLLEGSDELAARAGASLVAADDTSELGDGLVGLLVVLGNNLAKLEHLAAELGLGAADLVHHVEAHAAGGSLHGSVLAKLGTLLASGSAVQTGGGTAEGALGVLAVTLELATHSGELRVESGSDLVETTGGGGLVLVDEALELSVVLKVGLVALVAELDHAGHLSVHVGVHLGLGGAVGAHNTGGGVDAGGDLLHLLLHDGGKTEDTDLELLLGGTDTTVSLLAGGGDIGNGLGVPVVLKSLGGVQGSRETCGGVLHGHVDLMTLLGHGHVHTVELGSCGGHKCGDLVVSPGALSLILSTELSAELALRLLGGALEAVHLVVPVTHGLLEVLLGLLGVLLDLCRVGCDVLVHLVDAGVGSVGPRLSGALPSGDGQSKVAGSLAAIALDHGDRLPVTLHGCPPTTVSEASL